MSPTGGGRVRAVAFDAVGTLLYPHPPGPEVYAAVARRHGSRLTAAEVAPRFCSALLAEDEVDLRLGLRTSEEREIRRWQAVVRAVLTDVADPEACFEQLFRHFAQPAAWRCEPETGRVLRELSQRGLVLALASNYDSRLRSVQAGKPELAPLRHLVISSEVGWRKPAVEFFEAVCAATGTAPGKTLFVGDHPANDYDGARAAGLQAVWFARPSLALDAGRPCLNRLKDLPDDERLRPAR